MNVFSFVHTLLIFGQSISTAAVSALCVFRTVMVLRLVVAAEDFKWKPQY
jgi:hypothetical protein